MKYQLFQLENIVTNLLKTQKRVVIAITGLAGSGKSTLGKFIRKNGLGESHKPYKIAVIDDDVMSLNLFLIRPKIKIKPKTKDELKPFFKFLPSFVKVILYINTYPQERLSKADIFIHLQINETERIQRLKSRENDQENLERLINQKETPTDDLEYKFKIKL